MENESSSVGDLDLGAWMSEYVKDEGFMTNKY